MMKSEIEESPILKLTLSKPPIIITPPGMLTPPLQSHLSIPFQWEEFPGKPRTTTTTASAKPKVARCLELPPRLLLAAVNEPDKTITMPSPTTVLDGPYVVGRSLSSTFSFRKAGKEPRGGGVLNFGSWRWGDLKGNADNINRDNLVAEGSFDFSPISDGLGMVEDEILHTKVKITRVKKKGRFTTISTSNSKSHLWASIYESLKQVVPWRHMRQRKFERD